MQVGMSRPVDWHTETLTTLLHRMPFYSITNSKPGGRKATHASIVQSFVPCAVRFSGILFLEGWSQVAMGSLAIILVSGKVAGVVLKGSHPEYTTSNSKEVLTGLHDCPTIFLQQSTDNAVKTKMTLRNAPLVHQPNSYDRGNHSPPAEHAFQTDSGKNIHTADPVFEAKSEPRSDLKLATQQDSNDDAYSMFAMAKRQAQEMDLRV